MPALLIFIPMAVIFAVNIFKKMTAARIAYPAGIAISVLQMLAAAVSGSLTFARCEYINSFEFVSRLKIDFTAATVLFTIGLIAFVAFVAARHSEKANALNFTNLVLVAIIGMNGIVMATDLFTLYVFLEITAVASFILIAFKKRIESLEGSFKYLIMSALASVMLLMSIALIFMSVADTSYAAVAERVKGFVSGTEAVPFNLTAAFILFTVGLAIKAGAVPFHFWVPGAYSSAPAPVTIFLAGIVTKVAGVYTLLRLYTDVFSGVALISRSLIALGLLSIIAGALAAITQSDIKKMLAYSSISQVGYIILAVGIGSPLAFVGALLHFFNHASFKALLFTNSASIEERTGTRDMEKMGGLASRMPITGGSSVIGFLSTAGVPPLSGFWSKLIIIVAAWQAAYYAASGIALLASLLTLGYFLLLQRKVFFGKLREGFEEIKEIKGGLKFVSLLLSAVTLLMGLLFPLVLLYLQSIGLI